MSRRHGDFALVGVAATARRRSEVLEELRLVVFGCEERPRISKIAASSSLSQKDALELASAVAEDLDPMSDLEGDAKTKRIQARTLIQRALDDLFVEELMADMLPIKLTVNGAVVSKLVDPRQHLTDFLTFRSRPYWKPYWL